MSASARILLSERLATPLETYVTPSFGLSAEVRGLNSVLESGANEAAIFYCVRILEVLAADAVSRLCRTPKTSVFANLSTLSEFGLLPDEVGYLAHSLRRSGNDVRHVLRQVDVLDAELALLFLHAWLRWFFSGYRLGPGIRQLTEDRSPLLLGSLPGLGEFVDRIDGDVMDIPGAIAKLASERSPYRFRGAVLALWVELLLARGDLPEAERVLEEALKNLPADVRLRQLRGLAHSRQGNLDAAQGLLEPLLQERPGDEETAGILAGVYKRRWANCGDVRWLERSHRAYRSAWRRSRRTNTYLGVNAAATAALLGLHAESRALAADVRRFLLDRLDLLGLVGGTEAVATDYWYSVTLAEAELLVGEWDAARRRYSAAFSGHPNLPGAVEVSLAQVHRILESQGLDCGWANFCGAMREACTSPLVLGVTGHRTLPQDSLFQAAVERSVADLCSRRNGEVRLLTPLAEGADRLVARVVLAVSSSAELEAVLPLEIADYVDDFHSESSRREFFDLLRQASRVQFQTPPSDTAGSGRVATREEGYARAGSAVVDQSDVLIALWDGRPARGHGGTAEVVEQARSRNIPLVWISTIPPYPVQVERLP